SMITSLLVPAPAPCGACVGPGACPGPWQASDSDDLVDRLDGRRVVAAVAKADLDAQGCADLVIIRQVPRPLVDRLAGLGVLDPDRPAPLPELVRRVGDSVDREGLGVADRGHASLLVWRPPRAAPGPAPWGLPREAAARRRTHSATSIVSTSAHPAATSASGVHSRGSGRRHPLARNSSSESRNRRSSRVGSTTGSPSQPSSISSPSSSTMSTAPMWTLAWAEGRLP